MDPLYLRKATAEEHERVEGTVPLMGDDLDRASYVSTLQRFYGFVKGWELWAAQHAPDEFKPEMEQRHRSVLLEQDLRFFGASLPAELYQPQSAVETPSAAAVLGSMYVLEGSTLGGQMIAAHVEKVLHLQRGEGNAFFNGYGDQTGSMWRRFKALLSDFPDQHADAVVAAAKRTFTDFGAWMTSPLPLSHHGATSQALNG